MNNLQAIADRVEIEALRGEYTDALMMRDWDRVASLFAHDAAVRMPDVPVELAGREEIRAGIERLQALLDYFVQTTHPGTIRLDGDTAAGRAYISGAHTLPRRQLAPELRRIPRPLPAHQRRLEVHRARLRDQIPRHHTAGGLGALVPQLTFPFPVRVIARILGLPEADWPRFLQLSTELIAVMRNWERAVAAAQELRCYFAEIIADRRPAHAR